MIQFFVLSGNPTISGWALMPWTIECEWRKQAIKNENLKFKMHCWVGGWSSSIDPKLPSANNCSWRSRTTSPSLEKLSYESWVVLLKDWWPCIQSHRASEWCKKTSVGFDLRGDLLWTKMDLEKLNDGKKSKWSLSYDELRVTKMNYNELRWIAMN